MGAPFATLRSAMASFAAAVAIAATAIAAAACGGDESTAPPDDGKVRPATNGVAVAEIDACNAVKKAFSDHQQKLACGAATTRGCPELLRVVYGTECTTFDEGTVKGCSAHYAKQTSCDDLTKAFDDCVLEAIDKGDDCD